MCVITHTFNITKYFSIGRYLILINYLEKNSNSNCGFYKISNCIQLVVKFTITYHCWPWARSRDPLKILALYLFGMDEARHMHRPCRVVDNVLSVM